MLTCVAWTKLIENSILTARYESNNFKIDKSPHKKADSKY